MVHLVRRGMSVRKKKSENEETRKKLKRDTESMCVYEVPSNINTMVDSKKSDLTTLLIHQILSTNRNS